MTLARPPRFARLFKRRKRGFNLIEMALVMGVVGMVLGGIWVGATTVRQNMKIADMTKDLVQTCDRAANVFPLWSVTDTSNNNRTTEAKNAGVFPPSWIKGNSLVPLIGSNAALSQWNLSNATSAGRISLYVYGVDQASCLALGQRVFNMNNDSNAPIMSLRILDNDTSTQGTWVDFPVASTTVTCPSLTNNRFEVMCRPRVN